MSLLLKNQDLIFSKKLDKWFYSDITGYNHHNFLLCERMVEKERIRKKLENKEV